MKTSRKKIYKSLVMQVINSMGLSNITALAQKLNITRQAVELWTVNGIPPARAFEIEQLTNGKIEASKLINLKCKP